MPKRILLYGFALMVAVAALTAAIISAAPAIALTIVVLFVLWLTWDTDFSDDKKKPP